MTDRRVLTDHAALRLLAHFFATAELDIVEESYYTDRRILEGMLPLIDAMIEHGDPDGCAWLEAFKADVQQSIAISGRDRQAYEDFLHRAPGRIAREIKRRQVG